MLVLWYGANKYAPWNWQRVPDAREQYFGAATRHLVAWRRGELLDPETGLPHLAHATCNLLFIAWFDWKDGLRSVPVTQAPQSVIPEAVLVRVDDGEWTRVPGRVAVRHSSGTVLVAGDPGFDAAAAHATGWIDNSHVPG